MREPRQQPYRSKQDYATPPVFIEAVKVRLGIEAFVFDFAADAINQKAPYWYSEADDALSHTPQRWADECRRGWGWLNPPFTTIGPWARHCALTKTYGGSIALLVPAAVGANWFREHVDGQALVLALNGRLAFMPDKPKWLYPKDCMLRLYSLSVQPGFEVWNWRANQQRKIA